MKSQVTGIGVQLGLESGWRDLRDTARLGWRFAPQGWPEPPSRNDAHGACAWDWPVGSLAQDGTRSDEMSRLRELRNAPIADSVRLTAGWPWAVPGA